MGGSTIILIYTNKDCKSQHNMPYKEMVSICVDEVVIEIMGIDLAKEINGFIASIQRFSNQALMSNAIESNNTIPITLLVEYTHILSNTDLQSIYLHREIQKADSNTHTTEKHRVVLTANYIKPDFMSAESFNAQKQQTYWGYKEILQTEECNLEEVKIKDITLFQKRQKDYKGETIEINLKDYDWQHCNKQIIVFAF